MKKTIAMVVVFLSITVVCLQADTPQNPVLKEAKRLALAGVGDAAVTEYKRYLFFNPDSPAVGVHLSIAQAYLDQGRLGDAKDAFQSALSSAASDSVRDAIRIEISVLAMAQGAYSSAQMELLRISSFSKTALLRNRADLFLCLSYILTGDIKEAGKISSAGAASGDSLLCHLDSLVKKVPRYSRKSPQAAKIMSTVLPGLGQVYAHDLRGGLNALAISAITGSMTVHSILYGYFQEAIFTDSMLFWRYYSGNLWLTAQAAEKYNAKRDRLFFNAVIDKFLPRRYLK